MNRVRPTATVPSLNLPDLLELLDLQPGDAPAGSRTSTWTGRAQQHPADRVFGGLLLAQALCAAGRTAGPGQRALSLQADFLAGVPTTSPLVWQVTRLSDGPSLSTRRSTLLSEDGSELFTAVTRWGTVRDDLPSHHATRPAAAPDPDGLPGLVERFRDNHRVPAWWRMERPVHFRHVEAPPYLAAEGSGNRQTVFVATTEPLPPEPVVRAAMVGYVTDMSILEPAFRALGSARHAPGSRILSLTHTLTFHADPDLTDWHQFDCRVESVAHGRAHGVGELFDAAGRHVATAAQLGLVKTVVS